MEQYAQKLTDNWDAISDQLPEFRSVQRLALAAGIAFWVREHRVQVNPIIWTIPNQEDSTPLYSPALAIVKDGDCVITGGVTLTPDDKGSLPGRTFFQQFASILDAREQASGSGLFLRIVLATIVILSLILLILVTAGILWLLEEWANRASPQGPGYWKTVRVWVRILLAQGFLSICAWPLISDANTSLSIFDKAFVAFAVTMIASPLIFFVAIRRLEPGNRGSGVTLGKLLCALSVPGVTGTCSSLIALLTLIFFGSVPTKAMDGVLTAELTPANTLLMHQSYLNGKWIPQFKRETHLSGASKPGPVYFDGDSSVPGALMQPVAWPGDMQMSQDPAIQYYSPDGLPPYGREKSP